MWGSRVFRVAKELCFESTVRLEHSPLDPADLDLEDAARTFPVDYGADEMPDLAYCIECHQPGPMNKVGRWAHQFLPPSRSIGTLELLTRLSQGINYGFLYRRREAKGIQLPVETLWLGHGSCRDFAMLMIKAPIRCEAHSVPRTSVSGLTMVTASRMRGLSA